MRDHAHGTPDDPDRWVTLLDRVLAGECTAAERLELDGLLAADPALSAHVDTLRRGMQPPPAGALGLDRPARAARLLAALGVPVDAATAPRLAPHDPQRPRASHTWPRGVGGGVSWRPWRYAVAAVLVVGGVLSVGPAVGGRSTQSVRDFATTVGSRATVTLRDGTRLTLGPATRLRVASDFGRSTRAVELDGEAVFVVVHDVAHPFVVQTHRTTVRDIGTTFAVRSYAADPRDQIAVAEGAVGLGALVLRARDVATVDATGHVALRSGANVARYLAWAQGHLVFDAAPLSDVVRDLSRRFDLEITVADSVLATKEFTGDFGDQSVDVILDDITAVLGAQYRRTGRAVVIRRREAGASHHGSDVRPPINTALNRDARE